MDIEDVLGREIKENDLVIGMVISRNSDGIRFGVFNGTSVNWLEKGYRNDHITTSTMNNIYLVENPVDKELEIKQKIIEMVAKDKQEKEEQELKRKALKRIPTKELIIGESYEDDRGYRYVYLGLGTLKDTYNDSSSEGYIYLNWFYEYDKETDTFERLPGYTVLKNPKKLVKVLDEKLTDYIFDKKEFEIVQQNNSSYTWDDRRKKLIIKLQEEC